MERCDENEAKCTVITVQSLIGGKWKIGLIWFISQRTRRFNELKKLLPGITQKMLTMQLRELEKDHIIHREVYPVVPPRVEYSLTEIGRKLLPVFGQMQQWGEEYLEYREKIDISNCRSNS